MPQIASRRRTAGLGALAEQVAGQGDWSATFNPMGERVDLHTESTGAREEIIGGVRSGRMRLGDQVTWKAWHFGLPFRMTSSITEYERPARFVDEQTRGPFAIWRHEHRFESDGERGTRMVDLVDYHSPLGPIGRVVDRLRLEGYTIELLQRRNEFLRQAAETSPA